MSSRPARHRRPDQSSLGTERLLRLGVPAAGGPSVGSRDRGDDRPADRPVVGGWVPERPPDPAAPATRPAWSLGAARWVPSRRAVLGLGLVVLVAVLVAVVVVWRAQPAAQAAPRVSRSPAPTSGAAQPQVSVSPLAVTRATGAQVVVHVVGAVRRPGLVRLPAGSRVVDAVRAAGGETAAAEGASVNLARPLVDGEQVVVQRRGRPVAAAVGPGTGGTVGGTAPAGPVDLNTATLESLDGLPGIGPVLAQRILDWRTAHGRFSSVDELGEVSGIGEATLSDLRPVVTV